MRLRHSLVAALLLLVGPALAYADTVYFSIQGQSGIKSVSGTILQQNSNILEIKTPDGKSFTIPMANVFQVIKDAAPGDSTKAKTDPFRITRQAPAITGSPDFDMTPAPTVHTSHFGVVGGMNISNMSVDPASLQDEGSLKSYSAGAWWSRPVHPRVSLLAEAMYSVKGDAETSGGYTASTRMNYLDVPVLAKFGFRRAASWQPSLFVGPALSFNLSAKAKLEGPGSTIDMDVKDQVKTVDLGAVLGGGVDFPMGGRMYGVEVRYSKGLSNAVDATANGTAHNDVIAILGSVSLQ